MSLLWDEGGIHGRSGPTPIGFALIMTTACVIGWLIGWNVTKPGVDRKAQECASKGGEMRQFDRVRVCVRPGTVIE